MALVNSPFARMSQKDVILTQRQVEGMIADGRTVFIVDGRVLKVDAWLGYHPGGDKAIMHMVGRDATDEFNAYGYSDSYRGNLLLTQPLTAYIRLRPASTC